MTKIFAAGRGGKVSGARRARLRVRDERVLDALAEPGLLPLGISDEVRVQPPAGADYDGLRDAGVVQHKLIQLWVEPAELVLHLQLRDVILDPLRVRLGLVQGQPYELDAAAVVLLVNLIQYGNLLAAGDAPRGPDVDDEDLAAIVREVEAPAVD